MIDKIVGKGAMRYDELRIASGWWCGWEDMAFPMHFLISVLCMKSFKLLQLCMVVLRIDFQANLFLFPSNHIHVKSPEHWIEENSHSFKFLYQGHVQHQRYLLWVHCWVTCVLLADVNGPRGDLFQHISSWEMAISVYCSGSGMNVQLDHLDNHPAT